MDNSTLENKKYSALVNGREITIDTVRYLLKVFGDEFNTFLNQHMNLTLEYEWLKDDNVRFYAKSIDKPIKYFSITELLELIAQNPKVTVELYNFYMTRAR